MLVGEELWHPAGEIFFKSQVPKPLHISLLPFTVFVWQLSGFIVAFNQGEQTEMDLCHPVGTRDLFL